MPYLETEKEAAGRRVDFHEKKEKDTLIYLFFCLKCILIIVQKN